MALKIPPEIVSSIVTILNQHSNGASSYDVTAALPNAPTERTVQRWLADLVHARTLEVDTTVRPHLYRVANRGAGGQGTGTNGPEQVSGNERQAVAQNGMPETGNRTPDTAQTGGKKPEPADTPASSNGPAPTTEPKPAASLNVAAATSADTSGKKKKAGASHQDPRPKNQEPAAKPSPTAALLTPIIKEVFNPTAGEGISNEARVKRNIWKVLVDAVRKFDSSNPWPAIRLIIYAMLGVAAAAFGSKLVRFVSQHPWITVLICLGVILALLGYAAWRKRTAADKAAPVTSTGNPPTTSPPINAAPPFGRRNLHLVLGGSAVAVAAVGWGIWYWVTPAKPSEAAISKYVVDTLAPLPVKVAALDLTYLTVGSAGCTLTYTARIETTDALFQRVNPADYLRAHFPNEFAAINAAKALLAGPDGPRLRAAVGSNSSPPDSWLVTPSENLVILSVQTKTGAAVKLTRTVDAWQHNGDWVFQDAAPQPDKKIVPGDPRPAGAAVFVLEYPDEAAKLKSFVADHAAYAGKVQAAAIALADQLDRERRQRIDSYVQLLRPGTMFVGTAMDAARTANHRVALEITACSAANDQITARLHNELWYDTRPFKGTWTIDAEAATVTLQSSAVDAITVAGPLVTELRTLTVVLRVQPNGATALSSPSDWELHRVDATGAATVKTDFVGANVQAAASATAVGRPLADASTVGAVTTGRQDAGQTPNAQVQPSGNVGAVPSPRDSAIPTPPPSDISASQHVSVSASAAATNNQAPISNNSPSAPVVPAYPPVATGQPGLPSVASAKEGSYVLDHNWLPLPASRSQMVQSTPQKLGGALSKLSQWEDSLVGNKSSSATTPVGELILDSRAYVPVVSGKNVVIAYVGPVTPITSEQQKRYPVLKDYPLIELAVEQTAADGKRHALLYPIAPGFIGFGPKRIAATLEWVDLRVIRGTHTPALLLRCTTQLPPGRYALMCGAQSYEMAVE